MVSGAKFFNALFLPFLLLFVSSLGNREASAQENPLPLLPGLEASVEFWKLVFTRYGSSEIIFHDTEDPLRIYKVLEASENNSRRWIRKQRRKTLAEYGVDGDETRIRAQRGVKDRFAAGLARSGKFIDQIRQILEDEGVPPGLAYLPLVESAFNVHARSRAGAVGIWQFMPTTGRKYLRVSSMLDERKDPLESTRAAARFLKENYQIFGNWPLAITAYNYGREGIQRAVKQLGTTDLTEIVRRYDGRTFGFASKSFYAELLAAVEVAKRSEEFFPSLVYETPVPLEQVHIERTIPLLAFLRRANMSRAEFFEWNPAVNTRSQSIPAGYRVKVPEDRLDLVQIAYLRTIGKGSAVRRKASVGDSAIEWVRHRVARGETLSEIARLYEVSVRELQRLNELSDIHSITAGEYLTIPLR